MPVVFSCEEWNGTLVLGTDGLFDYISVDRLRQIALAPDLEAVPRLLIASVRLPSCSLHYDTTALVCRQVG